MLQIKLRRFAPCKSEINKCDQEIGPLYLKLKRKKKPIFTKLFFNLQFYYTLEDICTKKKINDLFFVIFFFIMADYSMWLFKVPYFDKNRNLERKLFQFFLYILL